MRISNLVASTACVLALGCTHPGEFRPVVPGHATHAFGSFANATAAKPGGAAPYMIGHVLARSEGAYRAHVNGEPATIVQVALEVDNPTAADVAVESLYLDELALEDGRMMNVPPIRIDGPQVVPSGTAHALHAYFRFPAEQDPDDIDGFTLAWTLRQGDERFRQRTRFRDRTIAAQLPREGDRARP